MLRGVPIPLTRNVNFNHVLHERVFLVTVAMTETPRVADEERVAVTPLSDRIARVALRFGFMEKADVPKGLQIAVARGQIAPCNLAQVTYFTGHETIIATTRQSGMVRWRKALFAMMSRNAQQPGAYFNLPSAQLMEIGAEFEI
jgi:KUP system potassium uptake protein